MSRHRHRPAPSLALVPPSPDGTPPLLDRLADAIASEHWSGPALRQLAERVGGTARLAALSAAPLEPVGIDPADFAEPVCSTLRAILDAFAAGPGWLVDREHGTILHRLLARLSEQPEVLCNGATDRTAAALVWLVVRSTDRSSRPQLGWIWAVYGVAQSASRAHALYRALGFATGDEGARQRGFPDPALMPARERSSIISQRDDLLGAFERHVRAVEAAKPVRKLGNGTVAARGGLVRPVWAAPGTVDRTDRRMVALAIDRLHSLDEPPRDRSRAMDDVDEVISLTVPDAWALIRHLQVALGASAP